MADDRDHDSGARAGAGAASVMSVVALIIAIIALILAWAAYNRTGADLDDRVRDEVQQGLQSGSDVLEQGADEVNNSSQ